MHRSGLGNPEGNAGGDSSRKQGAGTNISQNKIQANNEKKDSENIVSVYTQLSGTMSKK